MSSCSPGHKGVPALPEIKGTQVREGKRIAPTPLLSSTLLLLTLGNEILLFTTEPFQLECRREFGVVLRWLSL